MESSARILRRNVVAGPGPRTEPLACADATVPSKPAVALHRLPGRPLLDDPPPRALDPFYREADGLEVVERVAEQMIGLEPQEQRLKETLASADGQGGAADVFEEE